MKSQKELILRHLLKGGSLTPLDALTLFNCFRLPARIFEIKQDGYPVKDKYICTRSGKRVKQYYMEGVK